MNSFLPQISPMQNKSASDLKEVKNSFSEKMTPDELEKAARDFEAFFVSFVFDMAQKGIEKSDVLGSRQNEEMFQGMFIQEVTKSASQNGKGFGIADMIMKQVHGRNHTSSPQPSLSNPSHASAEAFVDMGLFEDHKLSSTFGLREDPFHHHQKMHEGIDLAMPVGTPIKAQADGTVVYSGDKGNYGNTVVLEHSNDIKTLYAHAQATAVFEGQKIQKGDIIGYSGNTGRSTGPHLHFEVHLDDKPVDPLKMKNFEKKI